MVLCSPRHRCYRMNHRQIPESKEERKRERILRDRYRKIVIDEIRETLLTLAIVNAQLFYDRNRNNFKYSFDIYVDSILQFIFFQRVLII